MVTYRNMGDSKAVRASLERLSLECVTAQEDSFFGAPCTTSRQLVWTGGGVSPEVTAASVTLGKGPYEP